MRLGKFLKIILLIFDVTLLAVIVISFIRHTFPIEKPIFWIAVAVEIGLGYLAFWTWMRSLLGKEYRKYRIAAIILLLAGLAVPYASYFLYIDLLQWAAQSDIVYYFTMVTLIIYSSFIIDRYLKENKKRLNSSPK